MDIINQRRVDFLEQIDDFNEFKEKLEYLLNHFSMAEISKWVLNGWRAPILCAYIRFPFDDRMALLLIEKGVDVNLGFNDNGRYTPMMLAIKGGKLAIIRALLEKGVEMYDSGLPFTYLELALDYARLNGQNVTESGMCQLLLGAGYDINTKNQLTVTSRSTSEIFMNFNALFRTIIHKDINGVEFLLRNGADPNSTALFVDCRDTMKLRTLPRGLYTRGNTTFTITPLYLSLYVASDEITEMLLTHRADPNFRNSMGQTPLEFLMQFDWFDEGGRATGGVNLLLNHGVDIFAQKHATDHREPIISTLDRPELRGPGVNLLRAAALAAKRKAAGMALHRRLGENSQLRLVLSQDNLYSVFQHLYD